MTASFPLNDEQQWAKKFYWFNFIYLFYSFAVASIVLMYVFAVFANIYVQPSANTVGRTFNSIEKIHCLCCVITVSAYYTLWFHNPRIWASFTYNRVKSYRFWRNHIVVHLCTFLLFFIEPYGIFKFSLLTTFSGWVFALALLFPLVPLTWSVIGIRKNKIH
ncbi:MAG: hypothetical protein ACOYKE_06355 [Ferruginibacter sp.]